MATVQLGQFVDANADRVVDALKAAGIACSVKRFGRLVRMLSAADWGTRVFVDAADLERATAIAREIAPDGVRRRPPLKW